MSRCKDCRFWNHGPDIDWVPEGFGECSKILMPRSGLRLEKAYVVDAEEYHAALQTTGEFGCVLWEGSTGPIDDRGQT